jgi:ribose transport system ATP-binding protein
MLPMSIGENISITGLQALTRGIVIDRAAESARIAEMVEKLQIKIGSVDDPVATLSGGNQQKVVIAKWLLTKPRILLLNDPTRGIDVGTKQEIYRLLRNLADAGASIVLYSTDYDELIGCCDRVLILYDGRIVRVLEGTEITETNIVAGAFNLPAARTRLPPRRTTDERPSAPTFAEHRPAAGAWPLPHPLRFLQLPASKGLSPATSSSRIPTRR